MPGVDTQLPHSNAGQLLLVGQVEGKATDSELCNCRMGRCWDSGGTLPESSTGQHVEQGGHGVSPEEPVLQLRSER